MIAEARVLVTPDTTTFRSLLTAQLATATKGVVVPVKVTPVVSATSTTASTAAAVAAQEELAAASAAAATAAAAQQTQIARVAAAERAGAVAASENAGATKADSAVRRENAAAAAAQARAQAGVVKGIAASSLAFGGLRGATLAASGPFLIGAVAVTSFAKALQLATGFQTNLNVFAATAGATADQMTRVSVAAQQLGRDVTLPGVGARDAAEAMTELAKAGLSVDDSISAARGVLQLATAAAISNADATELAASALNAFGLAGTEAVHVADVLANAANESQGSIVDIGIALGQSAAVARQAGLSLEQTSAALTLFARNGLRGSDAGTSFRTALLRLINPSKEAAAKIQELGLHIRDSTGAINLDVFDEFARKTRDLTAAQRDQALALIFGQDAIRAAAILAREGAAGLDQETAALGKAGTAAQLAAARTKGLAGAAENAKNQIETFGITLGQFATGPAQKFVTGIGNLFSGINRAVDEIKSFGDIDVDTGSIDTLIGKVESLREAASFAPDENFAKALIQGADEAEKALAAAGQRMVREGFLTRFIDSFKAASPAVKKAMEDNVITPAEEATLSADAVGRAFLKALPHTSQFFQSFGLTAKTAVEQAATRLRDSAPTAAAIKSNLEDAGAQAKATAAAAGESVGKTIIDSLSAAIRAGNKAVSDAIKTLPTTSSVLSRDIAVAQAGGNQDQELSLLREQEQRRQAFLEAVLARPQTAKNVALAKEAAQNLQQTRDAIQSILDQRKAVAQSAASEAQAAAKAEADAAQKAKAARDQTFLDVQGDARTRQERLVNLADETEGLQDDINRRQTLRALITQQITALRASTVDEKTKAAAIKELVAAKQATSDEINRLVRTQAEQKKAQRAAAEEALANARLELAQTTFDLTGQKAPLERALDAEIKRQIAIKNAAKKGSVEFLNAQTEIRRLLKQKKDLNEEITQDAQDTTSGPSLVDLFNKAEQIARGAGNVGGINSFNVRAQPRIQAEVQQRLDIVNDPAKAAAAQQARSTDNLIQAIDRLTAVLTGNTASGTPITRREQNQWKNLTQEQRFFYQRQARQMVEQGLVG